MNQLNKDQIDFRKIIQALNNRKWLIIICVLGFLIPIIYYNKTAPSIFKAQTLILFDSQRGPKSIVNPYEIDLRQNFIENQIATVETRTFASKVYKALSEDMILQFSFPENKRSSFDTSSFIIGRIRSGLRVGQLASADVIKIGFEYTNPNLTMTVANTAADVLVQSNLEVNKESSTNVRELVEKQSAIYEEKLTDAETDLKNFKEKSNISVSPDRESQEIFVRITQAEVLYNQTKADLDAAKKRLEYIQQKLSQERKGLGVKVTEAANPRIKRLRENLAELEVQRTALKVQNYSSNHRKMIQLREQIERTKESIKEETLKITKGENIIDPLSQIQNLLEESITLEIEIESYKARVEELNNVIEGYETSLKSVPEKELELARLKREKVVNEQIYTMLRNKLQEARIAEAQNVSYIRIIDPAEVPHSPIKPRKLLNIIIGLILGSSFGIGLVLVLEFLDTSIKSVDELEGISNTGVLASIPRIQKNGNLTSLKKITKKGQYTNKISEQLITELEPKSPESEAFRALRTNLQFTGLDKPIKSVLITSPQPRAGKSLISANLAIATAQNGRNTVLVDADLRKPMQHLLFNKEREPGVIDLIVSARSIVKEFMQPSTETNPEVQNIDATQYTFVEENENNERVGYINKYLDEATSEIIKSTDIENLSLLTTGIIPPNPSEILSSKFMRLLLFILKKKYDAVIVDSPPVLAVTDSAIIAPQLDGVITIVRAGQDTQADIERTIESIKRVGGRIIGNVLNGVDSRSGYYYYYYSTDNKKKKKKKRK